MPPEPTPEERKKDAQRAFEIIDPVVQKFPNVAVFRDTRGHVLCRLERFAEAIPDLEAALPVLTGGGKKATHEMLALAYEKTGNTAFAEKHRAEAGK